MRSATATPSSSALCASMGPRTTSPIAQTLGRFVRQCSSTATKPRSSLRPTASAFKPSVLAMRPIETMSRSKIALCALPSASVYSTLAPVGAGVHEAAAAVEERDFVLLEEIDDAVVARLYDLVLALEHLGEIELETLHAHPVLGEAMPGLLEVLRGLQQRFGGNAADVGAGSAERGLAIGSFPVVDAGRLQSELCGADRGDVAAWTTSDHDH